MTTTTQTSAFQAYETFEKQASKRGMIMMLLALALSYLGPIYAIFFLSTDLSVSIVLGSFATIAGVFAVLWVVEPITYYPILGPPGMYLAFVVGNVPNKLLPAAVTGQTAIQAEEASPRAKLAAVSAIGGAVIIHVLSLAIIVGLLGTWLVTVIPPAIGEVAQAYIFPAVIGAILVQFILRSKNVRTTLIALTTAAIVQLALVPLLGDLMAFLATAVVVIITVTLSWFLRANKRDEIPANGRP